jgi:hypothetical protein
LLAATVFGVNAYQLYTPQGTVEVGAVSTEGVLPTYRYRVTDFTPAATATDIFTISGSATKIVKITKLTISGDATANAIFDVYLTKRTTANTGGTATNPTPTKADSADAAASAVLSVYSANPSALGTGTPMEGDHILLVNAGTPTVQTQRLEYTWGTRNDKVPTLRGVNQFLAINLNGNAVPAGTSLYVTIEWTEE